MTQTNLRPELAQRLRQRLEAFGEGFRHNLALIGPTGSGKTFQLLELLAQRPAGLLFIYCPLYRESCRSFLHRLLCQILQAGLLDTPAPVAPRRHDDISVRTGIGELPLPAIETLLRRAESPLPNTTAAIRAIESLLTRRLYGEAFNRALDAIPTLIEERHQPCVLILDEFLFLEELGLVHAFHELGKRVMTQTSTLFILSSSAPYRARAILRERFQLLFGQFELLVLEALESRSASAWLQQELRGLRGAKAISPFLIRWLGASPLYLTVFLKRLKELATLRKTTELNEALFFQTAWDVLGRADGALHQWCTSRVEALAHARHGARAIESLLQIASGVRTTTEIGRHIGRADLPSALQLLVEQDAVQRKGACWVIPDPILRCWMTTILASQRTGTLCDETVTRSRFEQYLTDTWAHWLQTSQLSFPEQVTRLLSNFRDDTVSLDSKTGRLPRFQSITTQRSGDRPDLYVVAEGEGKRWCCSVQDGVVDETAIANFDLFCRRQTPKPSRKVVITRAGVDQNARLLAKTNNMWVWQAADLDILSELYG